MNDVTQKQEKLYLLNALFSNNGEGGVDDHPDLAWHEEEAGQFEYIINKQGEGSVTPVLPMGDKPPSTLPAMPKVDTLPSPIERLIGLGIVSRENIIPCKTKEAFEEDAKDALSINPEAIHLNPLQDAAARKKTVVVNAQLMLDAIKAFGNQVLEVPKDDDAYQVMHTAIASDSKDSTAELLLPPKLAERARGTAEDWDQFVAQRHFGIQNVETAEGKKATLKLIAGLLGFEAWFGSGCSELIQKPANTFLENPNKLNEASKKELMIQLLDHLIYHSTEHSIHNKEDQEQWSDKHNWSVREVDNHENLVALARRLPNKEDKIDQLRELGITIDQKSVSVGNMDAPPREREVIDIKQPKTIAAVLKGLAGIMDLDLHLILIPKIQEHTGPGV